MKLFIPLISIALLTSTLFADTQDNNDTFERAKKEINKNGYMPAIVTPEASKSGIYGGLALSTGYIDSEKIGSNAMLDLSLIVGYNINEYVATEGRAIVSAGYDNGVDYKDISLFIKPKYEAYEGLNVYSLIGIGRFETQSINSDEIKSSKTSLQYGIGADYKLPNNFKIFADYTYLGKDSNAKYKNKKPSAIKSGAFTTGISYDFWFFIKIAVFN